MPEKRVGFACRPRMPRMQPLRAPVEGRQPPAGGPSSVQGDRQMKHHWRRDRQQVLLWPGEARQARMRQGQRRRHRGARSMGGQLQRRVLAPRGTCGMRGVPTRRSRCQARTLLRAPTLHGCLALSK